MKIVFALILSFMLFSMSCRENNTDAVQESIQSAEDNALAENEFSAIFDYVEDQGENNSLDGAVIQKDPSVQGLSDLLPLCATVTKDSLNKLILINFGTDNCLCKDGRYRRGVVMAQFDGKWKEIGSSVAVTLEDYYVNDRKITGTKTITRVAEFKWSTVVVNASITKDEQTISWEAVRTVERIEGNGTATLWDDVYMIEGSGTGTNVNGVNFTVSIDEPLKKEISLGCYKNFTDGIWTLQNDNGVTMSLNYDPIGGSPCDKIAEVTVNGKTRTITLR